MVRLVKYSKSFLDKSWDWLHDEEIKKLTMTPDFSKEEQLQFYSNLSKRLDYWIKGIAFNEKPVGVFGIKNITTIDGEYWGYLGEKDFWGKGIGRIMLNAAIQKAKELSLKTIYLHVADFNERAKKLYEKSGFHFIQTIDGVDKYALEL